MCFLMNLSPKNLCLSREEGFIGQCRGEFFVGDHFHQILLISPSETKYIRVFPKLVVIIINLEVREHP